MNDEIEIEIECDQCGEYFDSKKTIHHKYDGYDYSFCSEECVDDFMYCVWMDFAPSDELAIARNEAIIDGSHWSLDAD